MPQTLGDIKALLAAHGLRPRKSFGQNFLHDQRYLDRIVEAAELEPDELVLEVGPGTGVLSERLLEAGAQLVAVEIDRDFEPILQQQLVSRFGDRVRLVIGDALAGKRKLNPQVLTALRDAASVAAGRGDSDAPLPPFKFIANLPYNVASPLLANLAADYPSMPLAVVMVQKEVADRLTASPGSGDYGRLGVLVQAMCETQRICRLPPGCFWPPPQVESAVVRLRRRARPLCDDPHALGRLLQRLFSRRRKQLGSILGRDQPLPAGVEPRQRPEQLTVEQLCALSAWQGG